MSDIVSYTFGQTKDFAKMISNEYTSQLTQMLPFEKWKCRFLQTIYDNPKEFGVVKWNLGETIRVSPTGVQLLQLISEHSKELQELMDNTPLEKADFVKTNFYKELFKPTLEFTIDEPITVKGVFNGEEVDVPIWFNTTMKSVNLRPGFAKLDSAKPYALPLSDGPVHAMAGGRTGAGKSVLLNDMIVSLLYEYPPWEVDVVLADFKVVELSRYANRIPTPHVSIVSATESTEFTLSMFDAMIEEMEARQAVFTEVGVQNLKAFREKMNLVMPRQILIIDEFVQMYENIKIASQAGNDKADEQKTKINTALSKIARIGRSQGVHMLLSSQNMDGVLDEQTAGQFAAGICLASTPQVSNTLIGNGAGATIKGKGKAYLNLNKAGKDIRENVLYWVPFIEDSISEEEMAKGNLPYLQEALIPLYEKARAIGWKKEPYFYNEKEKLPFSMFKKHIEYALDKFKNPGEETEIHDQIYRDFAYARIPLGKEIAYTDRVTCDFTLKRRKRHNLVIASDDEVTKLYLMKLITQGIREYPARHVIVVGDEALYRQVDFRSVFPEAVVINRAQFPDRYIGIANTRREMLDIQGELNSQTGGKWDDKVVFLTYLERVLGSMKKFDADKVQVELITSALEAIGFRFHDVADVSALFGETGVTPNEISLTALSETFRKANTAYKTFHKLTDGFRKTLTSSLYEPIVIWWIGADEFSDVDDFNRRKELAEFLDFSCQMNIFNVITAGNWSKLSTWTDKCNFVIEHCTKQFFMDIGLEKNININKNSFQLHDREQRIRRLVRMFNL